MIRIENIRLADLIRGEKCINFTLADLSSWKTIHTDQVCRYDFFQMLILEEGTVEQFLDFSTSRLQAPAVSVVFPQQLSRFSLSADAKGRVIAFDSTVFCSEILSNELKDYNIDLQRKLNMVSFADAKEDFSVFGFLFQHMKQLYADLNMARKMQIKFLIKIFIFKLLDRMSSMPVTGEADRDFSAYVKFRALVDTHYMEERKLDFYCSRLGISVKKLTLLCATYGGLSPLGIIHERLSLELKKCFLSESLTLKEMAFRFGFSSQSALNKFIDSKFGMTPSALKKHLLKLATGRGDAE